MPLPDWGLAFAYWLHMAATVLWIGSLTALSVLVFPAARKTMNEADYLAFLGQIQGRLQQVGWFSLAILIGTGMFQMSAHPQYDGLMAITNSWAVAILAKHLVIGLMILGSAYATWGLTPALKRIALKRLAGGQVDTADSRKLLQRESLLMRINLVLSLLVLLLTAIARSA